MGPPILPVEIMCAILAYLPDPWWVVAARACHWWRACIERAAQNRRLAMEHFTRQAHDGRTLKATVQGGHTDVVAWLARESGVPLTDATTTAVWMATSHARSWEEAVVGAARDGGGVPIIVWIARNAIGHTVPMVASIVYGRDDCIDAMYGDPRDAIDIPPRQQSKFLCGPAMAYDTRVTACAIAAGRFGRDPHFYKRCAVDAATIFVAAIVGFPIDDLEHGITQDCNGKGMISAARWLEARRPPFELLLHASTAHGSGGLFNQRMSHSASILESAITPQWPRMRQLLPDDFLPGGVLDAFCDLDMDHNASAEKYLVMLLRPLLVDPGDWAILRSCLPRLLRPGQHLAERFKGKEGYVRSNCMR
jgi:hypothetical protein